MLELEEALLDELPPEQEKYRKCFFFVKIANLTKRNYDKVKQISKCTVKKRKHLHFSIIFTIFNLFL